MSRSGRLTGFSTLVAVVGLAAAVLSAPGAAAGPAAAAGAGLDWQQYLHGPQHSSVSLATAFTPSNAASASQAWHWQPPVITGKPSPRLVASPTVAAGRVYIGAGSGGFYALSDWWLRNNDADVSELVSMMVSFMWLGLGRMQEGERWGPLSVGGNHVADAEQGSHESLASPGPPV